VGNEIYLAHEGKKIYQTYLIRLIWYSYNNQRSYHEKISIKTTSQVQTIQRTVISRKVAQLNGNINKSWKGSHWFHCKCLL